VRTDTPAPAYGITRRDPNRDYAAEFPPSEITEITAQPLIITESLVKRKKAPKGTFDRTKYQREYMRKRAAARKATEAKE
jgi:hypothetical protein